MRTIGPDGTARTPVDAQPSDSEFCTRGRSEPHVVEVAAGIILSADRTAVLLARRPRTAHQGGCWEFPGGKIEHGESVDDALARELDEELGIQPCEVEPYDVVRHEYAEKTVRIHFRLVRRFRGQPDEGREGQQIGWFPIPELRSLRFPEANRGVVGRFVGER